MTQIWLVPALASVVLLAVVAVGLLIRNLPDTKDLSVEERAELAAAPSPSLQRHAWLGLAFGLGSLGVITAILVTAGAARYWEDDGLRLLVVGLFMVGLVGSALATSIPVLKRRGNVSLDERDRAVLARAPTAQSTLMILGLAAWMIALTQRFHDEGAVPVVYLYLIFGSIVLLMMIGQSLGILIGYRMQAYDGQG